MMKSLYLGNGDKQFKFADTTTEIHLDAFDNGSAADLTADAKVRIKNDSGYLLGISANVTDNHAIITSGQLATLPVGSYLLELWDTVNGGTSIYPSEGFLALHINENATGLSGGLISSITVDDFIKQFSDLSEQLKQEATAVANGLEEMSGDVESIKDRQGNVESQFQNVIDETTGKDVISAPELIAARNGKNNLKTRLDEEHAQVTAQLQQTGLQIKTKSKWDLEHSALGLLQKYAFPDEDFNGFPIKLMTDGYQFHWFFDITTYKHVGGTTYYISPTGSDDNDGLTEGTARKIFASVPFVDGDTVVLLDGIYPRTSWTNDTAIEKSINIIAKNPGKVIVKNGNDHDYALYSTYTKTYFTARSNVANVIQMLDDTTTTELVNVASIALVESTEGSWFNDGVNTYVHLFYDAVPSDNNCVLNLMTNTALFQTLCATKNVEIYVEGIKFIGGHKGTLRFSASSSYRAPKLYANKCQFLHAHDTIASPSFDAVSILGATAYFVDCEASFSNKDGFNYHQFDGTISYGLEINCIGKCNGYGNASGPYQNGSTAHDGSKVIRIGGMYYSNYGANVADVHDNTKSLNIACKAFNSTAGTGDGSDADFAAQQPGTTMWLLSCRGLGSKYNLYCAAGASMYVKDSDYTTKNLSGNIVDVV